MVVFFSVTHNKQSSSHISKKQTVRTHLQKLMSEQTQAHCWKRGNTGNNLAPCRAKTVLSLHPQWTWNRATLPHLMWKHLGKTHFWTLKLSTGGFLNLSDEETLQVLPGEDSKMLAVCSFLYCHTLRDSEWQIPHTHCCCYILRQATCFLL